VDCNLERRPVTRELPTSSAKCYSLIVRHQAATRNPLSQYFRDRYAALGSFSFAVSDEAIALLVIKKGRDWFASTVSIANLAENVRLAILEAIASRNQVSRR